MAQMTASRQGSISLDHLINEHVRDAEGRDIGKVEDLVLDSGSGMIDFAVVRFGGFLGMGGNYHLIPWTMLSVDTEQRSFTMDVTKEQVDRAPSFDRGHVPKADDEQYLDSVFGYWGVDRARQHEQMSRAMQGQGQQGAVSEQQGYSGQQTSSEQRGYSGQQGVAEQTGVTDERRDQGGGAGESYPSQSGYQRQPSQEPQQGGWIGSTGQSGSAGAGQSSSVSRDVSYGRGEFGPERRSGDAHKRDWNGTERRAGW